MTNPQFSAEATLDRGLPVHVSPRFDVGPREAEGGIVPQSYPAQCQGAQGFTKTECYGVVEMCQDCCQRYDFGSGYHDVCGTPYVCGACIGLPF
ncbi:hypothetical protein RKD24_000615 [Streptomyces calvus]